MRKMPPRGGMSLFWMVVAVVACSSQRQAALVDAASDVREVGPVQGELPPPSSDGATADLRETQPPDDAGAGEAAAFDGASADLEADQRPEAPADPQRYRAVALAAGQAHTCSLMEDGRVLCWGDSSIGALGVRDRDPHSMPVAVDLGPGVKAKAIAASRYATCAILVDGGVVCWGFIEQLGRPPTTATSTGGPTDASARLDFGPGRTARLIGMGYRESCAVLDDESIACWGDSSRPPRLSSAPHAVKVAQLSALGDGVAGLLEDGQPIYPSSHGGSLSPEPGDRFIAMAGSPFKVCVVSAKGLFGCANPRASSTESTLTHQTYQTLPTAVAVGDSDVCALEGTTVWCHHTGVVPWWSDPAIPPFVDAYAVNLGAPAVALSNGGAFQICAILQNGAVKCWGDSQTHLGIYGISRVVPGQPWAAVDFGPRP